VTARGLVRVDLLTSDTHRGLVEAIGATAAWESGSAAEPTVPRN
jgi:transposase-like protein